MVIPLFFLVCAALIFALNFKNFEHPRKWQFWRSMLYICSGFFILTTNPEPASLISFTAYLGWAAVDSSLGYLAKVAGAGDEGAPAAIVKLACSAPKLLFSRFWDSFSRNLSRMNWTLQIRSESRIVRFLNRLFNLENQNLLSFSLIIYAASIGVAAVIVLLFGSVQLASVISSESVQTASIRKFAVLQLMIQGPQFLLFWIGAGTLLCIVNSILILKGSLLNTAKEILVQFAGSTGVGAALGLVLGIVAPGIWVQMSDLGMVTESSVFEAPIDGNLAVKMSSVGLILGALIGTYTSLRKGAENFSNEIYKELFVFLSIGVSVALINYYKIASPESLAKLISDGSNFEFAGSEVQKLNDEQLDKLLISMPPEDFAKMLFQLDQQNFLFQFDMIPVVLCLAGGFGLAFIVRAVFRGFKRTEW
ncbi:hypothetical protein [Brevibacterium renqingii]|uniref:hypothetical protein n=1 Tax=Brevibacterium renqingii TaxID=2776916 RepID=UPI001ADF0B1A|nr:hypothetical protein [Brevibacterium renqingii]